MKFMIVLLTSAICWLWFQVQTLEDNCWRMNQALKLMASGLMELKNDR